MLCILYVNVVGFLLGLTGVLFERALPPKFPRRWIWAAVIPLSMMIPGIYRNHHASSVAAIQQAFEAPFGHTLGAAPLPALEPRLVPYLESSATVIDKLWPISSAVLLVWTLVSLLSIAGALTLSRRRRRGNGLATIDGVPVVVTDSMGPATVGVLRSRVVIPRWVLALPGVERRYLLRHEEEHRRAHDSRLLFLASLPLILAPWNFAFWWQLRRLSLAIEMDCDNRVVTALGDANLYGELLFKVAQAATRGPRLQPAFLGGAGMLERRLTQLLVPTKLRHAQKILLPAIAAALLALVFAMPHPVLSSEAHAHHTIAAGSTTSTR